MLIAGLAIIGFISIGLTTQEEGKQSEAKEATKSEVMEEEGSASEAKWEAESKAESGEKEAKVRFTLKIWPIPRVGYLILIFPIRS